ncbi:response regulator transcription factor [Phycicoccus sp. 3266]|uniref:response regulator transcription factor n=1 Tax=Phycicoccus sp. 3266 TaxID=2817751 RepID=UPI00285BF72F|nr:response regulator transcription factor [Phycicoccus sp. 3266]MDR6864661.1 DNA-binding response OmpR family regulator [Phycicoccus sp. 3266]
MPSALVVDDDPTVGDVVGAYLARAGFEVHRAADGATALDLAARTSPDVVVLDLMLPGVDGLEVCRRLRRDQPAVPVVMLTALGEETDRIHGLEVGADDYVTKPFSPRELVLRVQAILRRASAPTGAAGSTDDGRTGDPAAILPPTTADGDLVLDRRAHVVTRAGSVLALTTREFSLLDWFLRHPGVAHRREDLIRDVWGWDFGDQSTVTVHVRRLREKVEAEPSTPRRLVTVFGVGYRWDPTPPDVP